MRNLKRTLSLVLAAVMLVGMMVVGASAASSDFVDGNEITYAEAAEVMTALGVFEGTDKGAFNPTGILTREQAAKIVAVMLLGEEDANKLSTNSTTFKDVAANRWSAGYIGYCVQQGILAGTGNGNFDPEGELTGLAFAKMMLVALGYDAKVANYVGNDWAINVAADAVNAGIAPKGIVLADAMTREQAAQMAFQTLTADMVYYTNKGTSKFDTNGTDETGGEYYANSSTIFLVYDTEEKEYSVYTGIDNVPSMDGSATVYVNSKNGESGSVTKYVFISAASDVVSDSNKAQIYILAGSQSKLISDSEKGDYYTYDAVIDGKITTVDVEKDYAEKNIKNDIVASRLTINSKDVVTKITEYENDTKKDDYYISGVGTKKTTDGTVGLTQNGSTTYYTYAKDVVVFRIEDDEFNTSSINSVRDSDDAFKAIVKDGEVVALFITENGKDGGKPDIKSDFKFDSISASREENGTVKVTASCADIDDWNLKDAVIEFTVSKNNGDEQTFTKNLSGVKSYDDVMKELTVPGFTISANSTGTYDVSVLITFKGDNADTNTYTVSGSCSFTIA